MILSAVILTLLFTAVAALTSAKFSQHAPKWISVMGILASGYPLLKLKEPFINGSSDQWLVNESYTWISRFNIQFHLAADGLSLLLIALTLLVGLIAILSSWKEKLDHSGFFYFNILCTLAGVIGVFSAIDLFLFFVFWEAMLIPLYFLMVVWGNANRHYAALKFFLYTQAGGLLMLLAIIALVLFHYNDTQHISFNYNDLVHQSLPPTASLWIMLGFLLAFAVKLPLIPLHNWQPDTYSQAPNAAGMILAAVLSKMGGYGIIRFVLPLSPDSLALIAPYAMTIGAITIIYGAFMAFSQQHLKRMIAYSSLSHMGFVILGCFALNTASLQGAVMQMLAHGLSTAGLFVLAGAIESRYNTCDMNKLGGLWQTAPKLGALGFFFIAATVGMPGLGNFVAEFLVLLGSFKSYPVTTAISATALVFGAVYSLKIAQETFFGPLKLAKTHDLDFREVLLMLILAASLIYMGLHPQTLIDISQQSINHLTILDATKGAQP
jgi:NADH-quinone oxidoreductase subunit M